MNQYKKIILFCISSALVIGSNLGRADDIEIYFNSGNAQNNVDVIRPNILFMLDTSGSMSIGSSSGKTRMEDLKDAMENVLNTVEDVNVGVMRFKLSNPGGTVIFPISNIDGRATDVVGDIGEALVSEIVNTAFIQSNDDDGEEFLSACVPDGSNPGKCDNTPSVGDVSLSDAVLEFFDAGGQQSVAGGERIFELQSADNDGMESAGPAALSGFFFPGQLPNGVAPIMMTGNQNFGRNGLFIDPSTILGLRFPGVTIPRGTSNIVNAFIEFRSRGNHSNPTETVIVGQDIDDANPMTGFLTFTPDISTREQTTAHTDWTPDSRNNNQRLDTPDIGEIVQEIVSRPGWNAGQAMFFRFQANDQQITHSNNRFGVGLQSNTGGAVRGRRVFVHHEENTTRSAKLHITLAGSGTAVEGQDQRIALRFTNIRIPQGATLTEATLLLTPQAPPVDAQDSTFRIRAEQVDNSAPLQPTLNNISSRSVAGSGSVNWNVDGETLVKVDDDNLSAEESVDIRSVLQSVVNRSGWCGGNALTLILDTTDAAVNKTRFVHSHDSDSTLAPRLNYKFGAGETGCVKNFEVAQTGLSGDDAEQFGVNVNTIDSDLNIGFDSNSGNEQTIGLRFRDIDIPNNATILDAEIIFSSKGVSTGDATFVIKGIDVDNNPQFSNTTNNITDRPKTSAQVSWSPEDWTTGATSFQTSDVTPIIQEIVERNGWASGNNMGFVIENEGNSSGNARIAESADGDVSKAPRLRVSYRTILETPFVTSRQRLIEIIRSLPATGGTPITPTLVEASRYWRGENVFHGKSRNNNRLNRVSHPGSYCTRAGGTLDCNNTTINSNTDQFGVRRLNRCNMANNPDSNRCRQQRIFGNPRYVSPFNTDLTCATNHQVLLTDGGATQSSNQDRNYITSTTGVTNCVTNNSTIKPTGDPTIAYNFNQRCGPELIRFLNNEDQSSTLNNDQSVKTHTIGFALNDANATQYIKDLAHVGGGGFFAANNAGELSAVFQNILTEVRNDPTSFAAPALATNAFNKLLSRTDIYFGLFTPSLKRSWDGNVKKYNICTNSNNCALGNIIDADNNEAIDASNDKFKTTARSEWSGVPDGPAVTQGGAGGRIDTLTKLYTDTHTNPGSGAPELASSGQLLNDVGFKLDASNWDSAALSAMRTSICPTPSTDADSDCEKRMLYLLGKVHRPSPTDFVSNPDQRWTINDVLHSSPAVITYGGLDTNNDGEINVFFDKVIYGTNDGTLHMVNAETGDEHWRYMPGDFWGQQQQIFTNAQGNHLYGLDMTPVIQTLDFNNNGIIEPSASDKIRVFLASRRGGSNIYALDLTDNVSSVAQEVTPRFLWRIQGGSTDFPRLGQTWSQPRLAKIKINLGDPSTPQIQIKEVLIFGGGYDPSLDNPSTYDTVDHGGTPFLGNAIYIVDPENGNRLLSISGSSSGTDISVPGMNFSIPSAVSTVDSDADGVHDRIYVGDTGGQVWRVDLAPIETSSGAPSPAGETVVGKLAEISSSNNPQKKRRFFEKPSVVAVNNSPFSNDPEFDYILMGSGYRPHPLNTEVRDRFYAFRDFQTDPIVDTNDNNIADSFEGYPQASGIPFADNDLIDVTTTILDSSDAAHQGSAGWFYDFTQTGTIGEKVLSPAITLNNIVVFTTFSPESTSSTPDPCGASPGLGKAYNFDINSAGAALDYDGNGAINNNDRTIDLSSGIPSGVVPVFTNEGVIGIVGIEGGSKNLGLLTGLTLGRSHWREDTDF